MLTRFIIFNKRDRANPLVICPPTPPPILPTLFLTEFTFRYELSYNKRNIISHEVDAHKYFAPKHLKRDAGRALATLITPEHGPISRPPFGKKKKKKERKEAFSYC